MTNKRPQSTGAFGRIKIPNKAHYFVPDKMELLKPMEAYQTSSGHITPLVSGIDSYVPTGIIIPCYSYLATGRFFSTQKAPSEYGDADVQDPLIVLIHTTKVPKEYLPYIQTGAVVRFTRQMYTEENAIYRLATGNVYSNHVEYKIVPVVN